MLLLAWKCQNKHHRSINLTCTLIELNTYEKTYGFEEMMTLLKEKSIGKKVPIEIEEDTQRKREYGGQNFYIHFGDLE